MTDANNPPHIRGHHLICLHFFHGKGYSPEFVVNLMHTLDALEDHVGVVVEGLDDICSACPVGTDESQCVVLTDENHGMNIRELDQFALDLLEMSPGDEVEFNAIRAQIPRIIARWRAKACTDCEWGATCTPALDLLERLP